MHTQGSRPYFIQKLKPAKMIPFGIAPLAVQ